MPQFLAIKNIAKIFKDPLGENNFEGEAILIKRMNSNHLYDGLYLELWKVQFLDIDEDDEEEEVERYILASIKTIY